MWADSGSVLKVLLGWEVLPTESHSSSGKMVYDFMPPSRFFFFLLFIQYVSPLLYVGLRSLYKHTWTCLCQQTEHHFHHRLICVVSILCTHLHKHAHIGGDVKVRGFGAVDESGVCWLTFSAAWTQSCQPASAQRQCVCVREREWTKKPWVAEYLCLLLFVCVCASELRLIFSLSSGFQCDNSSCWTAGLFT